MENYRIIKITNEEDRIKYFPQEKILFWWHNPFRWEPYNDGGFDTLEDAKEALCRYIKEPLVEYIDFDPKTDCK